MTVAVHTTTTTTLWAAITEWLWRLFVDATRRAPSSRPRAPPPPRPGEDVAMTAIRCADLSRLAYESVDDVRRMVAARDPRIPPLPGPVAAGTRVFFVDGPPLIDVQLYVWDTPSAVFVAFRGSTSKRDLAADSDMRLVALPELAHLAPPAAPVRVHRGFLRQFTVARPELERLLLVRCDPDRRKRWVFTGHSLGGALATLAAACFGALAHARPFTVECHTFGSPRVGTAGFAAAYAAVVDPRASLRCFLEIDPVPMIPVDGRYLHVDGGLSLPGFVPTEDASPDRPPPWSWWVSLARSGLLFLSVATNADADTDAHSCDEYRRVLVPNE
jgi:hypothetical protein